MAPEPHRTFPVAADLKFAPPLWDLASTRAYGGSLKPSSNPGANIADSWVSHDIAPLSPKNERIQCHRKGFCGGVLSPFITRKAITVTFYAIIVDRSFPASSNGSKKPSSPTLEIGPVPWRAEEWFPKDRPSTGSSQPLQLIRRPLQKAPCPLMAVYSLGTSEDPRYICSAGRYGGYARCDVPNCDSVAGQVDATELCTVTCCTVWMNQDHRVWPVVSLSVMNSSTLVYQMYCIRCVMMHLRNVRVPLCPLIAPVAWLITPWSPVFAVELIHLRNETHAQHRAFPHRQTNQHAAFGLAFGLADGVDMCWSPRNIIGNAPQSDMVNSSPSQIHQFVGQLEEVGPVFLQTIVNIVYAYKYMVYVFVCLFIYSFIWLFIYLLIYLFIYFSIYLLAFI